MTPTILPNGRIEGTRTSVFHIIPYLGSDRFTQEQIAEYNGISMDQLQAALRYIEENREEVMRINREIDERQARGNSPEVQAKLAQASSNFALYKKWLSIRKPPMRDGRFVATFDELQVEFREWQEAEQRLDSGRNGHAGNHG